jgi:hypothetical protein
MIKVYITIVFLILTLGAKSESEDRGNNEGDEFIGSTHKWSLVFRR